METMRFSLGHFEFEELGGHLSTVVQTQLAIWV